SSATWRDCPPPWWARARASKSRSASSSHSRLPASQRDRQRSFRRLQVHVGVELGSIRLCVVLGKLGGIGDDVAHFLVDRLELVLARPLLFEQPRLHLLDRVVLGAHLLHLVLRAIFGRIGH